MPGKKMINFMAGLLFVGIFCLSSGALGSLPYDDAGLSSEVVFIDPSVREAEVIVSQLPEGIEVVRLSPIMDGVEQISAHLAKKRDLSAIHIISHGNAGHFVLNGRRIDGDFLKDHGHGISGWGQSLTENGDILFYACNLAATDEGKTFVGKFADLSGADVAASIDNTGSDVFDGDWELEYGIGVIETTEFVMENSYEYMLTDWTVNNNADLGAGSLRNTIAGAANGDTIKFDANYTISLDSSITIDNKNLIIDGETKSIVILNGSTFIPFRITGTSALTFDSVTLQDAVSAGAVIQDDSLGLLTLTDVTLEGNVDADGGSGGVTVTGELTLTGSCTIDTDGSTDANISITGTVDGAAANTQDLTLNAGTGGTISVTGAVGGNTSLKHLIVTNSNGATFTDNVTIGTSVTLTDTTNSANITFSGSLVTPALTTTTQGYNVNLLGGCTIVNDTSFLNTGTTTIGNGAGDSSTFTGGLDATAGPVSIAGTVTVSNTYTQMSLGETTVTDDSTLNQPLSEASITLSLGAVTINDGKTLTAGNGNEQGISFGSTINSASGGTGNLIINNDATFSNDVGGTTAIGTLTLTSGVVTANAVQIKAGTIAVNGGTFGQPESPSGTWDVDNVTIASGAAMNATAGAFNVSGDWNNTGTFNHKNGTVTLDGTNQIISGSTTFYNLTKNVTSAATLTFPSATSTILENTLNLSGTSGELLSLISSTLGTQWEIDPQGTRAIAYLDVKDSNNVNSTAINAVGTSSFSSGNNTNWTFAAPTITSFSPTAGGTNTSVIITGTNFTGATAVKFGGTDASDFTVYSLTQITAVVANGSTGTVTVTTPEGAATSSGSFTYGVVTPGTYYVDIATGNDSSIGTSANPWKTLHYAVDQINGGNTGTYTLNVALGTYSKANGEADTGLIISQSNVTVEGASGSGPIIDGTNATNWAYGIKIDASDVTLRNLYITGFTGSDPEGTGIEIISGSNNTIKDCRVYGNYDGISVWQSDNCTIQDSEIDNNNFDGISISESANSVITRNTIHDNYEENNSDGIIVQACSPEISRNKIYDNRFNISIQAYGSEVTSPTIKNNLIYEVTSGEVDFGILIGSNDSSTVAPKIYHNTIDKGTYEGIIVEKYGASTISPEIKYNIITNFQQYGIQNSSGTPTINYNDVWNNGNSAADNYKDCTAGANDISLDPKYASYSLQSTSPCINTIPSEGDPVTLDYPGYKRPRPGETTKDMGAYEYVADEINHYTLPGGTGVSTDYRMFTVPLNLGTGGDMLTAMENVLGSYDPTHWRAFLYTGTLYREFNSSQFASYTIKPGMGFWIITTYTDTIPFEAKPAPDGVDYVMELQPGWHLIGLPWLSTQISLSNIKVTDGVYTYAITTADNNLTQKFVWDFTGDGPDNGYVKQDSPGFLLQYNTGYFFKVVSPTPVRLIVPTSDARGQSAPSMMVPPLNETTPHEDDELPPPPPGSDPIPDIKANGQDGPVAVNAGDSVSVSVSLDPGTWSGRNADWWVAARTPFGPPLDWYTYAYPVGWLPGIQVCVQMPLFEITEPFSVLDTVLPAGNYIFYFAVDGNMDGETDATWVDSVEVRVE